MAKCSNCKKENLTTSCPICKKPICVFCADKHKIAHGVMPAPAPKDKEKDKEKAK